MKQIKAKILSNVKISTGYFLMRLEAYQIAGMAKPGQFIQIRCTDFYEPFLRRPFSIHRAGSKFSVLGSRPGTEYRKPNTIDILYKVVGKATEVLSKKKTGEYLDVIGPLGNGFNLKPNTENQMPILVAGGMGVAPLVFLTEELINRVPRTEHRKPIILIGAITKSQILCEKEFKDLGCDVKISTDDGSKGFKGKVTELLEKLLSTVNCQLSTVYACGPKPMLKEISRTAKVYNIPCQISLEEHMACGIGACMGCVIKIKNQILNIKYREPRTENREPRTESNFEYKRVCKDGPVFEADEIVWERR